MSEPTIVLAQLEVQGCTAELFLNDVPISRITPARVRIENVAVEHLLVPGTNVLEVLVEPGSRPSLARDERRELSYRPMQAIGRLIRFPEGVPGLVEHGTLLGEARFSWADDDRDRRMFPQAVAAQMDLGAAHGRWSWQDAPVLALDEALIDEACALLDELELAFRHGHADAVWRLAEPQLVEVQRAYPAVTETLLRAELAALLQHHRAAADPVLPRRRASHDFRLAGGGRLLQLLDDDHSTSFKLRDPGDGSAVPYRLMLARIDQALRIVR